MALIHDLADDLARDAIALSKRTGDIDFPDDLGNEIGRTSTTLEEAYMTSLRLLRAEERARQIMANKEATIAPDLQSKPARRTRSVPKLPTED